MEDFKQKYGPWALVTGASSGIGDEFARQLAAKGLDLILVARRKDKLAALADTLSQQYGVNIKVVELDLTSTDYLAELIHATQGCEVGLLINNAGMSIEGELVDVDLRHHQKLLALNCTAPLELAHYYGRQMKERKKGGILFTSSISAFSGSPFLAHYAASKAYELYLAEGMAYEMKPYGVTVSALCPGITRTEMTAGVKNAGPTGMLDPDVVVKLALDNLGKKVRIIPGWRNQVSTWFMRKILSRSQASAMIGGIMAKMIAAQERRKLKRK